MKRISRLGLSSALVLLLLTSCGISQEVQDASDELIEVQKSTMNSQSKFHLALIKQTNLFLDIELKRSADVYDSLVSRQNRGLSQALGEIYAETSKKTLAEQKMEEENTRQLVAFNLAKELVDRQKRDGLLNKSKENMIVSSKALIEAEEMKLKVLISQNKYLKVKRPTDRLLDALRINTEKFQGYIGVASEAIDETKELIEEYNKIKK